MREAKEVHLSKALRRAVLAAHHQRRLTAPAASGGLGPCEKGASICPITALPHTEASLCQILEASLTERSGP